MSYDDWKTTDPRDSEPGLELGQVECPWCNGEGHGREDGGWYCRECNGEGWVWEEDLAALEAEEMAALEALDTCSRCGCEPCD